VSSAAILDVDGTLVDSNYQHTIAWYRAFREHDLTPAIWRIHRHIGMGGDQLVAAVAGEPAEEEHGDSIRVAEGKFYDELIDEVQPFEGARELLVELRDRGHQLVLASSAKEEEAEHYIELLDAKDLLTAYTTSADVERTKPAPDLVAVAMQKAGTLSAVMIGDATWDVEAATRADIRTLAVITGGFAEAELREAGALDVFESVDELRLKLDVTPLR
jgi:HAD superfamily hydrolase (TIGR01549 family)